MTLEEDRKENVIVVFKDIKFHHIFDIKMDGKFTLKARFVTGGNTADPPTSLTYYIIASRDSVWIDFTLYALNDIDIW